MGHSGLRLSARQVKVSPASLLQALGNALPVLPGASFFITWCMCMLHVTQCVFKDKKVTVKTLVTGHKKNSWPL